MTDYKQLCAELLRAMDEIEECEAVDWSLVKTQPLKMANQSMAEARAALAEPEPQHRCIYNPVQIAECGGPCEQGPEHCDCGELWVTEPEPEAPTQRQLLQLAAEFWPKGCEPTQATAYARAVLARWGNHPGSPDRSGNLKAGLTRSPAAGEVAELVTFLRHEAREGDLDAMTPEQMRRAADLLERLSPPQPIPVSERLPGPGDCDTEGRCWTWAIGTWRLSRINRSFHTHWLSAHALPLPS